MKKLGSHSEMKAGKVYNLVYSGTEEAYGRINGKKTILVLETSPKIRYVQMYVQFCEFLRKDDLRSSESLVINPSAAFKEYDIFEPENEAEWFKHSAKFSSLSAAVKVGVLTKGDIKGHPVKSSHSPFLAYSAEKGKPFGVATTFRVEDRIAQPYLQDVHIWWNSWEEMYADFAKFGVNFRR